MTDRLRSFLDTGNLVRYLLSFVLAFTIWAWVTAQRDPEQTYRANQLAVTAIGVPAGLDIVGSLPTVDVRLQGPRSVIETIDTGSIQATVDLSDATGPGTYRRQVEIDAPSGLRKTEVTPRTIVIELDAVVSKTFKLELLAPEAVPRNLSVTDTVASPSEVTVTGVQRNVDRVARVLIDVSLTGQESSFTAQAIPRPVDENNVPVDNVEISPGTVTLTVSVEVRGKEIPVFVRCECDAADGYEVVGQPIATPATVVIDGPREALAQVQYIYTTPIDTSSLQAPTVLTETPLDTSTLPSGVTIERTTVDVSVRVDQATFSKTFDSVQIQVLNTGPGLQVVVDPPTITITIEGPQQEIEALTSDDFSVIVDASGAGPGTFSTIPRVILPPRVRYSEPPGEVVVTVSNIPPTPTTVPTATATATAASGPTATP